MRIIFVLLIMIPLPVIYGQTDTLVFHNGDIIVGEIKSMNRGVIMIETPYSDSDFLIEWEKVKELYSRQQYIISLESGERLTGTICTDSSDRSKLFLGWKGGGSHVENNHVVYIKPVEKRFIDRLKASVDLGFSVTKANNLRQFTTRSYLGYLTDIWTADARFDAVRSSQDSVANTERTDAGIKFNYFIGKNWFVLISGNFLQNDEQKLKLRSNPKTGLGNYIILTNDMYLAVFASAAWNNETYTDPGIPNRRDGEANIGSELNLFDMGDLGLLTSISIYKSLKEGKRLRADFKFDVTYDLPLDFYVKLGYTLNYDNRPVQGASERDYVFQTTFGWEW